MTPEAAGLLWELARNDARHPNQNPHHALRMLASLASFDRRGVTAFQQTLPTIVERGLRHPQRDNEIHDPLTVLDPLLAADGHQEIWSAHTLTFRPFLINPDGPAVAELRSRVLDLAFGQLTSPNPRRAAAAVKTIGAALTGPVGGFGLEVSNRHRAAWEKRFNQVLARLRAVIHSHPPAPVVAVALRDQVQWHAEHSASMICRAAREVLTALPRSPEHELARALHGGPADPPPGPAASHDYLDRHSANQRFLSACATTFASWPEHQVITVIEQLLSDLHHVLGDDDGRARPFLSLLAVASPSHGEALCIRAQHTPGTPLASLVSAVMSALAQAGDTRVVDLACRLLATGDIGLARQVAHAFGIQRARTSLLDGEARLLHTLVEYPDPDGIVTAAALGAVRHIAGPHRDLAIELLTSMPAEQNP